MIDYASKIVAIIKTLRFYKNIRRFCCVKCVRTSTVLYQYTKICPMPLLPKQHDFLNISCMHCLHNQHFYQK